MTKIYLISPPKINVDDFAHNLDLALGTKKIPTFQLRLKDYDDEEVVFIGKKLLKICHQYKTLFILNDRLDLALKIGADGVHLGVDDGNIALARKMVTKNFIIGASCYDSKHLAVEAVEAGADYVSFGTFFPSNTKNSLGKPTPEILQWGNEILDVPLVAIGGINANNCQIIAQAGADFIAVVSGIWQSQVGIEQAINDLSAKLCDQQYRNSIFDGA